jgi:23S rRNA (uracil-5-)-methyltransferase RumA
MPYSYNCREERGHVPGGITIFRGYMGFKTYTCPIARSCGGCEWLAVPYPIQLRRKQQQVEELLGTMAREDGAEVLPIAGMAEPKGFRHKAATPFSPARGGRIRSGFYSAGTHRIVRCDSCLVEAPGARAVLTDVARVGEELGMSAYQEDRGRGLLRHAVVRCGYATDEVLLTVVANGQRLPREGEFVRRMLELHPELTSIVLNVNQRRTNAILGRDSRTLCGPGSMRDALLGCTFKIGPTSFYQTNPAQTEVLYRIALEGAGLRDGSRLLDAYCGCGTIGICAAAHARSAGADVSVTGVDQVGGAVISARWAAQHNGLDDNCTFVHEDATAYMESVVREGGRGFDVVVLDPPRAGSTPRFLTDVARLAPKRVVYVSCNVKTQARDLALLRQHGYRIMQVAPVDMFPHTKHVESVVSLVRG